MLFKCNCLRLSMDQCESSKHDLGKESENVFQVKRCQVCSYMYLVLEPKLQFNLCRFKNTSKNLGPEILKYLNRNYFSSNRSL